jgi:hypothetical protein
LTQNVAPAIGFPTAAIGEAAESIRTPAACPPVPSCSGTWADATFDDAATSNTAANRPILEAVIAASLFGSPSSMALREEAL